MKYGCDNFARAFTLTSTGQCRLCERAYATNAHGSPWSWRRTVWTDKNEFRFVSLILAFGWHSHIKCAHRFEIVCIWWEENRRNAVMTIFQLIQMHQWRLDNFFLYYSFPRICFSKFHSNFVTFVTLSSTYLWKWKSLPLMPEKCVRKHWEIYWKRTHE